MENIQNNEVIEDTKIISVDDFDRFTAHAKLLGEMSVEHSPEEDMIHNYLSELLDIDDELCAGVLKKDRTIKGSIQYAADKAYKRAQEAVEKGKSVKSACVVDNTVYEWVREYFIADKIETKPSINFKTASTGSASKPKKAKETSEPSPKKNNSKERANSKKKTNEIDSMDLFADFNCDFEADFKQDKQAAKTVDEEAVLMEEESEAIETSEKPTTSEQEMPEQPSPSELSSEGDATEELQSETPVENEQLPGSLADLNVMDEELL